MTVSAAAESVYANVSYVAGPARDAAESVYANVSYVIALARDAAESVYANVGIQQPEPVVYGVVGISEAVVGQTVDLIGTGFGATRSTFCAKVEAQRYDGVWVELPIVSFTNVTAAAASTTPTRVINAANGTVDYAHQRVSIQVPEWASPPHLPIRVVSYDGFLATQLYRSAGESVYINVT